jgi:hypothetical protein
MSTCIGWKVRAGLRSSAAVAAVALLCGGLAEASLTSRGGVTQNHGFPDSYTDSAGRSLGLCLDRGGNCLLELPNPNAPVSFPDNFGPEAFYFLAEATMPTNGGGEALCVLALEAAFANEVPRAGDQMVFGRILVSTIGNFSASGATGGRSDVARFVPTQLGATTQGSVGVAVTRSSIGIPTTADVSDLDVTE